MAVSATGRDARLMAEQLAGLSARVGTLVTYAVGLRQPIWEYDAPPHVVSVPVRLEYPWNRQEASAAEHGEAYGEELAAHLAAALAGPDDGTTAAQLNWYGRHPHLSVPMRGRARTSSAALA